jgi:hypothetical protein
MVRGCWQEFGESKQASKPESSAISVGSATTCAAARIYTVASRDSAATVKECN